MNMKCAGAALGFLLAVLTAPEISALQTTPESEAKAREAWLRDFRNAENLPEEEAIPLIADGLRRLGEQSIFHDHEAARPIYLEGQKILLSIPGHATYFRDRLEAAKPKVRTGEMDLIDWSRLLSETTRTLQHMPSEEAVEVLVGLAKDPFGDPDAKNPADYKNIPNIEVWDSDLTSMGTAEVWSYACSALERLEIEPPPYRQEEGKGTPFPRTRHQLWADWWAKVQAGKLRYRFKGSDVLHPVEPPSGTGREQRRPERRTTPREVPETPEEPPAPAADETPDPAFPTWSLAAAITLVLGAVGAMLIRQFRK